MATSCYSGNAADHLYSPPVLLLEAALVSMDRLAVRQIYDHSGLSPLSFCEQVIAPALSVIGEKWDRGDLSLSHVYMSGRVCEEFMEQVLGGRSDCVDERRRVALAVLEDYHLLGKRLVGFVLKGAGVPYLDYGTVSAQELVRRVQRDGVRVLLISALMLPSALKVREVRDALDRLGVECRIVVGGAPFRLDPALHREVGADLSCDTASQVLLALGQLREGES
ncbi:cobalamin-dependent protein [Geomonas subterranea]|uniref:Cobalamin-dependent protein n=1 Tax=Geomonas subterranea TaxID=2847989 RepID=A0ABX8LDL1_9BACT|nr:cobalamin-dependent protein [Geomonas subterranea]QXE90097.1 cobalamin-dependent protein [Geomonas subterranea]QXM07779.1 cobalamin-dependent protein [Geomonas subterranea]